MFVEQPHFHTVVADVAFERTSGMIFQKMIIVCAPPLMWVRRTRAGRVVFEWQNLKRERNEALDCRCHASAALHGLLMGGLNIEAHAEAFERMLAPASTTVDVLRAERRDLPLEVCVGKPGLRAIFGRLLRASSVELFKTPNFPANNPYGPLAYAALTVFLRFRFLPCC
jgi:hypothetical protein